MVGLLNYVVSGAALKPSRGHCIVLLGKTLYSQRVSLPAPKNI